jgi:hypothetical protein
MEVWTGKPELYSAQVSDERSVKPVDTIELDDGGPLDYR